MASAIEIANRALTKLGETRILAFTDDTKQARDVNSLFAIVRDAELRSSRWRFALARAQLPALATAPAFGFARQFQLPNDCLKVLEVGTFYPGVDTSDYIQTDNSEYAVEGNAVLTNLEAPLNLRYVKQVTDPTLFDSLFVEAFACRLAAELAETLTESGSKKEMAWREYDRAKSEAIRANSIERPPHKVADDTWVVSRV
jgi:hypothetical protein